MGFFDFLADVGTNLFGGGDEAEEIKEMLGKELGSSIINVDVTYEDGTATLVGVADTVATREKAVLLVGNVKGIKQVNADAFVVPAPKPVFYTIQKGDSLSKIAKQHYGDAMKYPMIFEANREVIKNADLIYPGQVLRIPQD